MRVSRAVPITLMIGAAGWIDVVGVLQLLKSVSVFPSFMSGNTTQIFTSLVRGDNREALLYGGVVSVFVLGALLGRLLNDGSRAREAAALLVPATLLTATGLGVATEVVKPNDENGG